MTTSDDDVRSPPSSIRADDSPLPPRSMYNIPLCAAVGLPADYCKVDVRPAEAAGHERDKVVTLPSLCYRGNHCTSAQISSGVRRSL